MTDHEHDFGPALISAVRCCAVPICIEWRACTDAGWVPLTREQHIQLTMIQWEDLIYAQAMQIVHGSAAGLAKYRYLAGYDPEEKADD